MRRYAARPYGHSVSSFRVVSMLMLLALLWVVYGWVRDPGNWRWLADADALQENGQTTPAEESSNERADGQLDPQVEIIVPGSNDLDPAAVQGLQIKLKRMTDRTPLQEADMASYWQLMAWSRTQRFDDLKARAVKGLPFTQLWDDPNPFRGKLLHLRLHVRRVLQFANEQNNIGVKDVYEAWGWTDDSKSYPYVIVFPERPEGLPVGADVRAEIEFTGYFLKLMSYTAFDVSRGAPLLIGKIRLVERASGQGPGQATSGWTPGLMLLGVLAIVGYGFWNLIYWRRSRQEDTLPEDLPASAFQSELTSQSETPSPEITPPTNVNIIAD